MYARPADSAGARRILSADGNTPAASAAVPGRCPADAVTLMRAMQGRKRMDS